MTPELISMACFINPGHQSVSIYIYIYSIVARQRLRKNVTAAANTRATKELLEAAFSMRSVSYQRSSCYFITCSQISWTSGLASKTAIVSDPNKNIYIYIYYVNFDRLCGLVVRVPGYRSWGSGFDSLRCQIFWEVVGLEHGPLSSVRIIEELLEWKSSGSR
jgi:hypothetical protein